eukprot:TRINITY_DN22452_c0_g2_i1.p1 TRINITY_DN22452_c0_g2~~TRINITY_DN22452_c0_g2_i1.p1  ORF type:complete len:510 (+),score=127.20 TRINITY_DN22452_c0_g2_i1:98-1627(+)
MSSKSVADIRNTSINYGSGITRAVIATAVGVLAAILLAGTNTDAGCGASMCDLGLLLVGACVFVRCKWPKEFGHVAGRPWLSRPTPKHVLKGIGAAAIAPRPPPPATSPPPAWRGREQDRRAAVRPTSARPTSAADLATSWRSGQQPPPPPRVVGAPPGLAPATAKAATTASSAERRELRLVGGSLEAETEELLRNILPTPASDAIVDGLLRSARAAIATVCPEARLYGSACVNLVGNSDVSSAEIDVNIDVQMDVLVRRLEQNSPERRNMAPMTDGQLKRSAMRLFSKKMAQSGSFVFHRCNYNGDDPTVCMRVLAGSLNCDRDVYIVFGINGRDPKQLAALAAASDNLTPRGAALGVLLRRWARDRGISYAAKGHLGPFAWAVLALYYLQNAAEHEDLPKKSAAQLFSDCIRFYAAFDWCTADSISIHASTPEMRRIEGRPLPVIEDPFNVKEDLAACVQDEGAARLDEELQRAKRILEAEDARLVTVLERWVSPVAAATMASGATA